MNKRIVKKEQEGRFGKIVVGPTEFEKTLHGRVLYVDYLGAVVFVDNDDISYRMPSSA